MILKEKKKIMKYLVITVWSFIIFAVLLIIVANISVWFISNSKIYEKETIPVKKVWLLLGTSKYMRNWNLNLFYKHRIAWTVWLYKNKKISKIIVSGDNSQKNYNEPKEMKSDLVKAWIPKKDIHSDYAWFRTLDSIVRAKKVFQEDNIIIISQRFHLQRAIVLAKFYKVNAIWFPVEDVPLNASGWVWFREKLARVKMWIDILTRKKPKFLGEKITIK